MSTTTEHPNAKAALPSAQAAAPAFAHSSAQSPAALTAPTSAHAPTGATVANTVRAPTEVHAPTGATAADAVYVPTEAHDPPGAAVADIVRAPTEANAPTGVQAKHAPVETPYIVTSTPHHVAGKLLSPIDEGDIRQHDTSPPRTRSGTLRVDKPRKRARTSHSSVAAASATEASALTATSNASYNLGDTHELSRQFASLGLQNRPAPLVSQPAVNVPYWSTPASVAVTPNLTPQQAFARYAPSVGLPYSVGSALTSHMPVTTHTPGVCTYSHSAAANTTPFANIQPSPFASGYASNLAAVSGALNYTTNADITLSASHVAARQVMSKDLPIFSGNPEEWPLFITNYEQSTERCGFSEQENLIRLQRCLRGPALEAVRGKLMMPSTVQFAIETLRMLYGRPDVIHQTLQRKLRRQPNVKLEQMDTLINFALAVQNYRATMQAIGLGDYLNDPMLLNDLLLKLPCDLRLDWGRYRIMRPQVNMVIFDEWLFSLASCASQVTPLQYVPTPTNGNEERRPGRRQQRERIMLHDFAEKEKKAERCPKCCENHRLADCSEFVALRNDMRWRFVRKANLCIRCFRPHLVRRCASKKQCGVDGCQQAHNPLLHGSCHGQQEAKSRAKESGVVQHSSVLFHDKDNRRALFRYIAVTLYGKGRTLNTFAFIDEGSACTLLEHDLASELNLDGPEEELCLQWTGDIIQNEVNSKSVTLHISSQEHRATKFMLSNVRTVTSLNLPIQSLSVDTIFARPHLKDLPIAPYSMERARILIGLDNLRLGVPHETRESNDDELIAARCKIGWSVYGRSGAEPQPHQRVMHICPCNSDTRLEELVKAHFALESVGIRDTGPVLSKEDERAHRIMATTTKYIPLEKRWETGLLWRHDQVDLPDSLPMARRRLQCLEAKMKRNPVLNEFMLATIADYQHKGYVRKLNKEETIFGGKSWFLPIFTVTNLNKNKTRLVWDAAAAVRNTSLNSVLSKGPDLLRSLVGVLIRFREHPIALCGDIKEMFHQIRVRNEDQAAQKFLWRDGDPTKEPDVYVMQVMTFGAACSPSLANHIKNENARRFYHSHPLAVKAILENTFVDDWLQSVQCEDDMIQLATAVRNIHADGGFEMRNWISNSKAVTIALTGHREQSDKCFEEPDKYHEKVLGMWWSPGADVFRFFERFPKEVFDESSTPTKRQILKVIMMVFDPLGLLGFFVVYAKILMQEIWRSGVSWDEPIQQKELDKWWRWVRYLRQVPDIRLPRCYPLVTRAERIELHTFVDASIDAYAAAVYLRAVKNNNIACCLVTTKTRVSPLKPISVPRLELMAAVLGLRLTKLTAAELSVRIDSRTFWSDSKNVLCWIQSDARKYQQFVAVRIGEILQESSVSEWRWVPSAQNVADEATKWSSDPILDGASRWFRGPSFLSLSEACWPTADPGATKQSQLELVYHIETQQPVTSSVAAISPDPQRFSKWEKLRGAQQIILKFLHKVTRKANVSTQLLKLCSKWDIENAENIIVRNCQEEAFSAELSCLEHGGMVSRKSSVYKCSPYIDDNRLLRMKGRIDAAKVAFGVCRPIILPRRHQVTSLIADYYHRRFHHHHNEIVVNEMRQIYVIQGLRALVRAVARRCQRCRNRLAQPHPPEMAALPPERVSMFTRPFTNTGVDFFGPLEVVVGRRREKRWGVLFTCLTVRAVHLEISPSLSTDSFLLVLKQFIARRGTPTCIWSDNGTNFRGASRILKVEIERLSSDDLERRHPEIKWRFIPPASPHMGGCWERMVRSVKSVLMDILPSRSLREEVLRAAMADVENVLNSRPLTYVPLEAAHMEALTPNHFLIGHSSGIRHHVEESYLDVQLSKNFRISSQIADQFWKRWIREYLPCLTRRGKWFEKPADPIAVDDVVIVVDDNAMRNCWKKGVIVDVLRAKDGAVRSAVVRTVDGLFTRPVVKLAKLDVKG